MYAAPTFTAPTYTALAPPSTQSVPTQAPAAPEPVAQAAPQPAQQAGPQTIPQPGQQVPQPNGRPATMTPETPPSEQEYWHSPNAEVVKIPGRSSTTHDAAYRAGGEGHVSGHYARFWGDAGSPNTAGIWLLAVLPIIGSVLLTIASVIFSTLAGGRAGVEADPLGAIQTLIGVSIAYAVVITVMAWSFAGNDIKTLRKRGYDPPTIWWMLVPLSPLAYFIARGKAVRREGRRAWPPELVFFLLVVLPWIFSLLMSIFAAAITNGLIHSTGLPV
jgi:hypothetical protein